MPTAPGSGLEGVWEPLSGTCPTHVPSLLSWHTYYWLHARLQAGYSIFLIKNGEITPTDLPV